MHLPDPQLDTLPYDNTITIDQVGMAGIALPVDIEGRPVNGSADITVNLLAKTGKRGIHMSRLYLALDRLTQCELTPALIQDVLHEVILHQQGGSSTATFVYSGEVLLSRPALLSLLRGWKAYPIRLEAKAPEGIVNLKIRVPYSSACPCSTSLSEQLLKKRLKERLFENIEDQDIQHREHHAPLLLRADDIESCLESLTLPAIPHSQRSWAEVTIRLEQWERFPVRDLIDLIEKALGTAVQTAVKRVDEQAFAAANAQNQMFCEDAVRVLTREIRLCFPKCTIRVEHQESLHAHQAVASIDFM